MKTIKLLKHTYDLISGKGWTIGNVDTTVCLEKPKLLNHIDTMRQCIAEILQTDLDRINVKATTTEKLGFVGTQAGISAHAVVLLKKV